MTIEIYFTIALLVFLITATIFGRSEWIITYDGGPERERIFEAAIVSLFAGAVWPLTLIVCIACVIVKLAMIGRKK